MGSREEQTWVFVSLPVETKELQNGSRQRDIAIVVTFAVSDVKEHAVNVDVADLEVETFAEPQAAGVEGGEEDSMARKLDVIEQESDLRLDTAAAMLKGGASGPAITAKQSGDSTRWKKFQDPSTRRQMLDTMHKVSPHVIIPFGPRARPAAVVTDTTKRRKADSLMPVKIDTAGRQAKAVLKKTGDSAALKPKDKPVVQKDSSTNQAP